MGYFLKLKEYKSEYTSNPIHKIIFTSITSGLCGSITSFSGWQIQCNKNFFLQFDFSWGNNIGSYNGGRFFEWIVCMWSGVVIPLSALHFGVFISSIIHQPQQVTTIHSEFISSTIGNTTTSLTIEEVEKKKKYNFFIFQILLISDYNFIN